jgi:hypothetical protein
MSIGFLNLLMLAGLAAVVIPPIIHLLNRRRFDVVDWGAMQFLEMSQRTRRKVFIEELLLMLLRMALIAILVLALAAPYAAGPLMEKITGRDNRDAVLVIDGSTSMSYNASGKSIHDAAKEWADAFLSDLAPGDAVAVLHAKQQVIPVLAELTTDHDKVRDALARLSPPRGGMDWPAALLAADEILKTSHRPRRDIVIISDGQKFGWADDYTLERWRLLAPHLETEKTHLWCVSLGADRPANPPNWSLSPLRTSRTPASTTVSLETALRLHGQTYEPPHRFRLEIDSQAAPDLPAPPANDLRNGQLPIRFSQTLSTPGSHLVSVTVEPDAPREHVKDHVPGDNRQDFAVFVPSLPVLLIDNGAGTAGKPRGSHFLRAALAPSGDRRGVIKARVESADKLVEALGDPQNHDRKGGVEAKPVADAPGSEKPASGSEMRPRVLILCNVPSLTAAQRDAVNRFLDEGGGVLITLGSRVDKQQYNSMLYQSGNGWLPAFLEEPVGDETAPPPAEGKSDLAAHPHLSSFAHQALELFRGEADAGFGKVRFPRYWKAAAPPLGAAATTIARFTTLDPFLIERAHGKGRVILCTAPLDDSWGTNLHRGLEVQEFPLLAHELVYYLAGVRSVSFNLVAGQPLIYQPPDGESPGPIRIQPPFGEAKTVNVTQWPLIHDDTREPGVYRLTVPSGKIIYYVVQADPRETDDLSPCSAADREHVASILPVQYVEETADMLAGPSPAREIWWWLMLAVVAFLCGEVWLTRRIVKGR